MDCGRLWTDKECDFSPLRPEPVCRVDYFPETDETLHVMYLPMVAKKSDIIYRHISHFRTPNTPSILYNSYPKHLKKFSEK